MEQFSIVLRVQEARLAISAHHPRWIKIITRDNLNLICPSCLPKTAVKRHLVNSQDAKSILSNRNWINQTWLTVNLRARQSLILKYLINKFNQRINMPFMPDCNSLMSFLTVKNNIKNHTCKLEIKSMLQSSQEVNNLTNQAIIMSLSRFIRRDWVSCGNSPFWAIPCKLAPLHPRHNWLWAHWQVWIRRNHSKLKLDSLKISKRRCQFRNRVIK